MCLIASTTDLVALRKAKILGFAIATVLTAYIAVLTLSNQVFALGNISTQGGNAAPVALFRQTQTTFPVTHQIVVGPGTIQVLVGKILSGQETQQAGRTTKSVLGDVCLSCWGGLAAHETQQGKELAGQATKSVLGINIDHAVNHVVHDLNVHGRSHIEVEPAGNSLGSQGTGNGLLGGTGSNIVCPEGS